MSALPPTADMCGALADVCFGPIADNCAYQIDVLTAYSSISMSMPAYRMSLPGLKVYYGICLI